MVLAPRWNVLTEDYDLVCLGLEDDVLGRLEAKGWPRAEIEKGRFRGVSKAVPTVNFSGWLLFCDADMDVELVYLTFAAIDAQSRTIETIFEGRGSLTGPIEMPELARAAPIPLHPGAHSYYLEKGYIEGRAGLQSGA